MKVLRGLHGRSSVKVLQVNLAVDRAAVSSTDLGSLHCCRSDVEKQNNQVPVDGSKEHIPKPLIVADGIVKDKESHMDLDSHAKRAVEAGKLLLCI